MLSTSSKTGLLFTAEFLVVLMAFDDFFFFLEDFEGFVFIDMVSFGGICVGVGAAGVGAAGVGAAGVGVGGIVSTTGDCASDFTGADFVNVDVENVALLQSSF
jgi:hypothetical protein